MSCYGKECPAVVHNGGAELYCGGSVWNDNKVKNYRARSFATLEDDKRGVAYGQRKNEAGNILENSLVDYVSTPSHYERSFGYATTCRQSRGKMTKSGGRIV
jgi:hypothetical protein